MTHTASLEETSKSPSLARFIIIIVSVGLCIGGMLVLESKGVLTAQELSISWFLGCLLASVIFMVLLIAELMEDAYVWFGVGGCLLLALYPFLQLCHVWPF